MVTIIVLIILAGVSINLTLGEEGIVTEVTKDATATAEDIAKGKTAWVNGKKIMGTCTLLNQITFQMSGYSTNYGSTCTVNTYNFKYVTVSGYTNDSIIINLAGTTKTLKNNFTPQTYDISNCESFTMRCNGSKTLGILTLHN